MRNANAREGEPGWFASLLGATVLIAGGFALGLVAGVVSEEPELVVGHLVGRSEEVAWVPDGGARFTSERGAVLGREAGSEGGREGIALDEVDVLGESPRPASAQPAAGPEPAPPPVAAAPPAPAARQAPTARRETAPIASLPPAVSTSPAPRSGFAVQVGAFASGDAAGSVQRKLAGKGFDSYVIPARQSGDGRWRVRVGPVGSRSAAEALAGRLKREERLPTWVLAEGGG